VIKPCNPCNREDGKEDIKEGQFDDVPSSSETREAIQADLSKSDITSGHQPGHR